MYEADDLLTRREQIWLSFAVTLVTSPAFIHQAAKLILRTPVCGTRDPHDPFALQRKTRNAIFGVLGPVI